METNLITDMDHRTAEHIRYGFEKFVKAGELPEGTQSITAHELVKYVEKLTAYANEDRKLLNQIAREMGDIHGYTETLKAITTDQVLFYLSCYTSWDLL